MQWCTLHEHSHIIFIDDFKIVSKAFSQTLHLKTASTYKKTNVSYYIHKEKNIVKRISKLLKCTFLIELII